MQQNKALLALRSLAATLTIGFILFFYSETLFWGRPGRAAFAELVVSWLVYSLLTYLFLSIVATLRVQGWATLLLAGGLYGWLAEGVLVQTMYDQFPVNLSWTGLAWHDLLSVCAGWYGLSVALKRGGTAAGLTAVGLGVFWGIWAVMWWQPEEGGRVTPLPDFAIHAFTEGIGLMLAYALFPRLVTPEMFQSRWGQGIASAIAILWFVFVAIPANPLAVWIAPPLFALTLFLLLRHRRTTQAPTVLDSLSPVPLWRYLAVLIMPLCAVGVYAFFLMLGHTYPTNQWVYFVVMPLGFIAYGVSAWRVWRNTTRPGNSPVA